MKRLIEIPKQQLFRLSPNRMTAFILRFQEFIFPREDAIVQCGTETVTAVDAEQADADPRTGTDVLNIPPAFAGTLTATKISAEESDQDPQMPKFRLFHENRVTVQAATQTSTFVQAEAADKDVSAARNQLFRCSSS